MSCEVKKKQHACTYLGLHNHYSKFLTHTTALKILNTVTKPFYSYPLVYYNHCNMALNKKTLPLLYPLGGFSSVHQS